MTFDEAIGLANYALRAVAIEKRKLAAVIPNSASTSKDAEECDEAAKMLAKFGVEGLQNLRLLAKTYELINPEGGEWVTTMRGTLVETARIVREAVG